MYPESYLGEEKDSEYTDLRATARRFLDFQRGYLRRRWALYYAVWATAVAGYFLVPFLLDSTRFSALPSVDQYLTLGGIDLALTIAGVAVSVRSWGLADRTSEVRSATEGLPSFTGTRNLVRLAIVLTIVIIALAISTRSVFAAYLLGDSVLLVLSLLLILHLHRAFRPIPVEGWVAIAAFVLASAVSYTSLLLLDSPLGHEIAWAAAVVVWFGCAAYARFGVAEDSEGR